MTARPARPPAPLTRPVGRRHLLLGVAAVGVLAACGTGATSGVGGEVPATRTVTHPLGTTEVPITPTRVLALDRRSTLPHLLLLGVRPVGALSHQGITGTDFPPVLGDATAGITSVTPSDGFDVPNLEQVAALRPDLILAWSGGIEEIYDELSAIAPTVAVEVDFTDASVALLALGGVLGKEAEARAAVAAFDADLAAAVAEVGELGSISLLQNIGDGQLRVYGPEAISIGRWITTSGGQVAPDLATLPTNPDDDTFAVISPENLTLVTGRTVVLLQNDGQEAADAAAQLEAQPLWPSVPAVADGRVLRVETQSAVGSFGFQGYRAALDALVEQWTPLP